MDFLNCRHQVLCSLFWHSASIYSQQMIRSQGQGQLLFGQAQLLNADWQLARCGDCHLVMPGPDSSASVYLIQAKAVNFSLHCGSKPSYLFCTLQVTKLVLKFRHKLKIKNGAVWSHGVYVIHFAFPSCLGFRDQSVCISIPFWQIALGTFNRTWTRKLISVAQRDEYFHSSPSTGSEGHITSIICINVA